MKKTLLATVVLTAITSNAQAVATPPTPVVTAPGQSAYDATQDGRIGVLEGQVAGIGSDIIRGDAKDTQQDSVIQKNRADLQSQIDRNHQVISSMNTKNKGQDKLIQQNAASVQALQSQASGLATKADFDKDQKRQDDAAKAETSRVNNALAKKASQADLLTVGGKVNDEIKRSTDADTQHDAAIAKAQGVADAAKTKADSTATGVNQLALSIQKKIDDEATHRVDADNLLRDKIKQQAATQATTDKAQDAEIAKKASNADLLATGNALAGRINTNKADITKVGKDLTDFQTAQGTKDTAQDSALAAEVSRAKAAETANSGLITANTAAIALKADQLALDAANNRIDTNETAIKGIQAKDTAQDGLISGNTAKITTLEGAVQSNTTALAGKVDQAAYNADQANIQQTLADKADKADLTPLQSGITKNAADIANKADKTDLDPLKTNIQKNSNEISGVKFDLANKADKADLTPIAQKADKNEQDIQGINTSLSQKVDQGAFKTDQDRQDSALKAEQSRAEGAEKANTALIDTKADQAALATETTRAQGEESRIAGLVTSNTNAIVNKADKAAVTKNSGGVQQLAQGEVYLANGVQQNHADIASNTAAVATNTAALATKADQTSFTALQQRVSLDEQYDGQAISKNRQDIGDEASRATQAEQQLDQTKADKTQVQQNATSIQQNTTALAGKADTSALTAETSRAQSAEQQNADGVATNKAELAKHSQTFTTLQREVDQKVDTSTYQQRARSVDTRFADTDARIQQQHDEQVKTNQKVAANSKQLANHEARITDLEANNKTNFNKLQNQQNKDRKEFRAGVAGAIALTQIPQTPQDHTAGFGMAVGTFNGENALAAGVSARVSQNVTVKSGLSWDTQGNVGAGAGFLVSY
ncbi:YadA-like family protein [Leclercia adecarboxylata]|uniref:YadA-like family protein n=1 Tax=Leclercia adecarboxylata TaxID=83655 RepID=UPI002550FB88|nr:YadA-like family protein [Leclercia adecarboxylata]